MTSATTTVLPDSWIAVTTAVRSSPALVRATQPSGCTRARADTGVETQSPGRRVDGQDPYRSALLFDKSQRRCGPAVTPPAVGGQARQDVRQRLHRAGRTANDDGARHSSAHASLRW